MFSGLATTPEEIYNLLIKISVPWLAAILQTRLNG